jgi:hypothetical protein
MRETARNLKDVLVNIVLTTYFSIILFFFAKKPKYFNKKSNSVCLIVGNGPSLNQDITKVKQHRENYDLVCVNFFAEYELYLSLKPNIYVFYDPIMWDNKKSELNDKVKILYNKILSQTTWNILIYAPYEIKKTILFKNNKNKNIKFQFFNNIQIEGFDSFVRSCISHNLGLPKAPNVIIPSLVYAINNGYEKIYLAGVDHSWHKNLVVSEDSKLYVKQKHFYDKTSRLKQFMLISQNNKHAKIHEVFQLWSNVFRGYWILKRYAENRGVEIINLTNVSFIDAFKKQ